MTLARVRAAYRAPAAGQRMRRAPWRTAGEPWRRNAGTWSARVRSARDVDFGARPDTMRAKLQLGIYWSQVVPELSARIVVPGTSREDLDVPSAGEIFDIALDELVSGR